MDSKSEVWNEEIGKELYRIGETLGGSLPKGLGFALLVYTKNNDGSLFYISDAERDDMIKVMEEFIAKHRANEK